MLYNKNVFFVLLALSACSAFGMQYKDNSFLRNAYLEAVQEADEFIIPYIDKFDIYKDESDCAELQLQNIEFIQASYEEKLEKEACSLYVLYKHATPDERLGIRHCLSTTMPIGKHLELLSALLGREKKNYSQNKECAYFEYAVFCWFALNEDLESVFKSK